MLDVDKAWESFQKEDSKIVKSSAMGEFRAMQSEVNTIKADTEEIKQNIQQLLSQQQAQPPMGGMPGGMPPMGGMPGGMPPMGGDAGGADEMGAPAPEEGQDMAAGQAAPEDETQQGAPSTGGGIPGLSQEDLDMLFGGNDAGGESAGGSSGSTPVGDIGGDNAAAAPPSNGDMGGGMGAVGGAGPMDMGGDAGAAADLGAGADMGGFGGAAGVEEGDTTEQDANTVINAAEQVQDKELKATLLRLAADYVENGGTDVSGDLESPAGGEDLEPLPDEAPGIALPTEGADMGADLGAAADADIEAAPDVSSAAAAEDEADLGLGEEQPFRRSAVTSDNPGLEAAESAGEAPTQSVGEDGSPKSPTTPIQASDDEKADDDKKVAVVDEPGADGKSDGKKKLDECECEGECDGSCEEGCKDDDCTVKHDCECADKIQAILNSVVDEIINAVNECGDCDGEKDSNPFFNGGDDKIESFQNCADKKAPFKCSIDDSINDNLVSMRGNDGQFYKIRKSVNRRNSELVDKVLSGMGRVSVVRKMKVRDAIQAMSFLKSQGVSDVDKMNGDLVDVLARHCDRNLGVDGANSFFKSAGIDVDQVFKKKEEPIAKSEAPAGGKHIKTLNEKMANSDPTIVKSGNPSSDSPKVAAAGGSFAPNVNDVATRFSIDDAVMGRQKR